MPSATAAHALTLLDEHGARQNWMIGAPAPVRGASNHEHRFGREVVCSPVYVSFVTVCHSRPGRRITGRAADQIGHRQRPVIGPRAGAPGPRTQARRLTRLRRPTVKRHRGRGRYAQAAATERRAPVPVRPSALLYIFLTCMLCRMLRSRIFMRLRHWVMDLGDAKEILDYRVSATA
jgi:hypothetical protein